jgi:MOSC domain-containing protein
LAGTACGCTVLELWRYPVKSLQGESLEEVAVETRGLAGDRLYAVTDAQGRIGSGKTSQRLRRLDGLLELRARSGNEMPLVTLPDGRRLDVESPQLGDFLSQRYGAHLSVDREHANLHHDAAPMHLLTTSSLEWLAGQLPASQINSRRFRPNIVLECASEGRIEDAWVGRRFALGSTVISVTERTQRCVMTINQQADLPHDATILAAVAKLNDNCLGVFAKIDQPGVVRIGDQLVAI